MFYVTIHLQQLPFSVP